MSDENTLADFPGYASEIEEILIDAAQIEARAAELGAQISADYAGRLEPGQSLVLIGALKGVFMFMADLCRHITLPVKVYFMDIAAHEAVTRKTGLVSIADDLISGVQGEHVIFVEEIVHAGLTLNYAVRALSVCSVASFEVCTMFNKEQRRVIETHIKYIGFELPDVYVVGYGLDYKERFRNLPFLAVPRK